MRRYEKEIYKGKWLGILQSLGVGIVQDDGTHHKCPVCKCPDGFRFTDMNLYGEWICKCGNGDGMDLVMRSFNVEFKEAYEMIEPAGAEADKVINHPEKQTLDPDKGRVYFRGGCRITPETLAGKYLINRGLELPDAWPNHLWYQPRLWHSESADKIPAMLAVVHNWKNEACYIHRTFLTPDGQKISRKLTPPFTKVNPRSPAVRLYEPEDGILGIAEGIETALAARELTGVSTWAALTANWLSTWQPPYGMNIKKVVIFGDNDASYTGHAAAYALAKRLVNQHKIETEVRLPKITGDWLDVLISPEPETTEQPKPANIIYADFGEMDPFERSIYLDKGAL